MNNKEKLSLSNQGEVTDILGNFAQFVEPQARHLGYESDFKTYVKVVESPSHTIQKRLVIQMRFEKPII